jgi:hypothetical protein
MLGRSLIRGLLVRTGQIRPAWCGRYQVGLSCPSCGPLNRRGSPVLSLPRARQALYLLAAPYNATGGQPHERHMVVELDGMTAEAIVFAIAQGWVIVEAGHSICLTDAGGPGLVEAG